MSTLKTRIDGKLFVSISRPDEAEIGETRHTFGDYDCRTDELARVMVYGELDTVLPEGVAQALLCQTGSTRITLADLEWQARGTVNGKRVVRHYCPPCFHCGKTAELYIPFDVWNNRFNNNVPIQIAWPDAHQSTRELLVSGTHPQCWNQMMGLGD